MSMANKDPQEPGKVQGYRTVPEESIALVNKIKTKEQEVAQLYREVQNYLIDDAEFLDEDIDVGLALDALMQGRNDLVTGFMWMVRSVMQPQSNW